MPRAAGHVGAEVAERRAGGIRPVSPHSLVDLVLAEIRRSLLEGTLVPGAPFSITQLSDRLGVSHIPVREALRRLEAEGLVELRPGRSARVAPMTLDDLTEIYHLRALLEADAMARAALLYSDEDLAAIEKSWELLPTSSVEAEEIFLRHRAFHQLLVEKSAGAWDRRILETLQRASERYVALLILEHDLSQPPIDVRQLHLGLLEAARSRSPDRARVATHEHLEASMERIATLLTREGAKLSEKRTSRR